MRGSNQRQQLCKSGCLCTHTLTLLQQQYEQFVVNYKNKPTHSKLEKKEGVYHSAQCSKILRIPIGNRSDFKRQTSTYMLSSTKGNMFEFFI